MALSRIFSHWRETFWTLILFAAFGIWLPMRLGIQFLDSVVLGAYVSLGAVIAAPSVATTGQTRKPILFSLVLTWAMTLAGLITVYSTRNVVVGPDLLSLVECMAFGAALCGAVATLVALVHATGTARVARTVSRLVLLGLLVLFLRNSRELPDVALPGAALLTLAWMLFAWLHRRHVASLVSAPSMAASLADTASPGNPPAPPDPSHPHDPS